MAGKKTNTSNNTPQNDHEHLQVLSELTSQVAENMTDILSLGQKVSSEIFQSSVAQSPSIKADPLNIMQSWIEISTSLAHNPEKIFSKQMSLWQEYTKLCTQSLALLNGQKKSSEQSASSKDRRFQSDAWNDSFFHFIKESYLVTSKTILELVEDSSCEMNKIDRDRALFFAKQYVDALSPSNFVMTNPDVLQETLKTGGKNLVKGMENLLHDIQKGEGKLYISQTDLNAFKIGENIATTDGKVVFRNDLIELIQYSPTTDTVYAQPLLIFPPFINKYYILDMSPAKSMIKWLVDHNMTVFVVSWRNPNGDFKEYSFENYIDHAVMPALEQATQLTEQKKVSVVGYCISGTMLSMALSFMKERKDHRIANITYFASQVDFSKAGELSLFIDQEQLRTIEQIMETRGGFLEGHEMATTFNLLRANDLIWSFVVNNYLLGKDPFPFDLLYWNADTTRIPMRLQLDYLENCYLHNHLAQGKMVIHEHIVDLTTIDIPMYIQASKEDHIAPAESVYHGMKLYKGKRRFVLAGSGHIAGVINHPDKNKYQYWTNSDNAIEGDFDAWCDSAKETAGSWWHDWLAWLETYSGKKVKARFIQESLCDAPGTYVLE